LLDIHPGTPSKPPRRARRPSLVPTHNGLNDLTVLTTNCRPYRQVVLASLCTLVEPHVLKDASSVKRVGGGLVVEASLLVPEGRHYEGANLLGVFGGQLMPYVKLVRAEVLPAVAAAAAAARRK
jgi:hypothetical protein